MPGLWHHRWTVQGPRSSFSYFLDLPLFLGFYDNWLLILAWQIYEVLFILCIFVALNLFGMRVDFNAIIDRYYADNEELRDLLLKHSMSVRDKALEVLDRHPEIVADRDLVYDGAMLHDIGIFLTDAAGIYCYGSEPYICHGMLGARLLRAEGLELLARIAERHTGTGLTEETIRKQNLPLPLDAQLCPVSIEEEIVCYADKFFSKSSPDHVRTVAETAQSLEKFGHEGVEKFLQWAKMFE